MLSLAHWGGYLESFFTADGWENELVEEEKKRPSLKILQEIEGVAQNVLWTDSVYKFHLVSTLVDKLTEEEKNFFNSPVLDVLSNIKNNDVCGDIYRNKKYLPGFQYLYQYLNYSPDPLLTYYGGVQELIEYGKKIKPDEFDTIKPRLIKYPGRASIYKVLSPGKYGNCHGLMMVSAASHPIKPRVGLDLVEMTCRNKVHRYIFRFDQEFGKETFFILEPSPETKEWIEPGYWHFKNEGLRFTAEEVFEMLKNIKTVKDGESDRIGTWFERNQKIIALESISISIIDFTRVFTGMVDMKFSRISFFTDLEPDYIFVINAEDASLQSIEPIEIHYD